MVHEWMSEWVNEWKNERTNKWTNESINQSINQSIHPSIDRSIDRSINQSVSQLMHAGMNDRKTERANERSHECMHEWTEETHARMNACEDRGRTKEWKEHEHDIKGTCGYSNHPAVLMNIIKPQHQTTTPPTLLLSKVSQPGGSDLPQMTS